MPEGVIHPSTNVATRARWPERRGLASDGERAPMPAVGGYAGGLSI